MQRCGRRINWAGPGNIHHEHMIVKRLKNKVMLKVGEVYSRSSSRDGVEIKRSHHGMES